MANLTVINSATFNFNGSNITVKMIDNIPWFVAKEICAVLELKNSRDAISTLDEDEKDAVAIADAIGRLQETSIISESGLYALVFKSRKPEAKTFRKWVTSEVLPAIRRDGGYMIARPDETPEELALRAMRVMQSTIERQKAELAITKPKALALDILAEKKNSYCITDAAKLLQLKPSELFEYLQAHGWIYRRHAGQELIGYQRHLINGDLEHKITTVTTNHGERDRYQVRIRQSGLVKLAKLLSPASE